MIQVNLFDKSFAHSISEDGFDTATASCRPEKVQWNRDNFTWDGVTVFTDQHILTDVADRVVSPHKVAWMVESADIYPAMYEYIDDHDSKYDLILTYKQELIDKADKYVKCPRAGTRIKIEDRSVHDKSKGASLFLSPAKITDSDSLRNEISTLCPDLDTYNEVQKKVDCLRDYMFSIVVETTVDSNWFTNGIIDCFLTGTVPVYCGDPNIGDSFNADGILRFSSMDELEEVKLSRDLYKDMSKAVQENFETAKKFVSTDDLIADVLVKKFELQT